MSSRRPDRLEIKRLGTSVGRVAIPVLIEQFFVMLMGIVNTMLASNIGNAAISGIGMIDAVSNIIISVFAALAIGGTVMVAQYTGCGDTRRANETAAQALTSSLILALIVTLPLFAFRRQTLELLYGGADAEAMTHAYDYLSILLWSYIPLALVNISFGILRGSGDTRTPMKVSILMNVVNLVFSSLLIYGWRISGIQVVPALGVRGAAIGLLTARAAGLLLILIPLLRGTRQVRLDDFALFKLRWPLMRDILWLGLPAGAEQLMFHIGRMLTQIFIIHLGVVSMAANAIGNSIVSLSQVPGNALCIAATTLVGQKVGEGDPVEGRRQLLFLTAVTSVANFLIAITTLLANKPVIALFTRDGATAAMILSIMISATIAMPLAWSTSFVIPAGLRGAGDIRYTLSVSLMSMWLVRILLSYVLTQIFTLGVIGVWLAMYADWTVRSIFFLRRLRGLRWVHRRISEARQCPR